MRWLAADPWEEKMETLHKVAIVGRPNVGKSALFNRIVGRRIAIVDREAGITRDRLGARVNWRGSAFTLIDTGGIVADSREPLIKQVRFQAEVAIAEAEVILFVVDVNDGANRLDWEVGEIIRKSGKPVIPIVNKCDTARDDPRAAEFYSLGFGDVFPVSAIHGLGIGEVMDVVVDNLAGRAGGASEKEGLRVAVVGKPNVGKSTFINYLLSENRLVVDGSPGTTRDAVDVEYVDDSGKRFVLVDTAGIKRSRRVKEAVEKYSFLRSQAAIERCDAAILMMDASSGVTTGDSKIAHMVHDAGKSCVIAVNKWDTVSGYRQRDYSVYVHERIPLLSHCPIEYTVATEGKRVHRTLNGAIRVFKEGGYQFSTGRLNRIIQGAVDSYHPPLVNRRSLKIFYATQVATHPPHMLVFVNDRRLMKSQYLNYLVNSIRKDYPFTGNPVRISLRSRK
jgi:GTP-binding protein